MFDLTNFTNFTKINNLVSYEELTERKTTALIFGIFGSLGVVLNATPLLLTYFTKLRNNFVNIFVSNLALADLSLSAYFLFGNTFYVVYREQMPELGCRWLGFLIFVTAYQEFMFPPLLSINRYISLYHRSVYNKVYTKWNMAAIIAGSWSLCAIMPLAFFIFGHTGYDTDNEHCCVVVVGDTAWTIIYWVVVMIPLIFFCDGVLLFCNLRIYKKLNDRSIGTEAKKDSSLRRNREVMWYLWADMSLPICFHTVYHILKFVINNRQRVEVRRFFALLYLTNSCLRGFMCFSLMRPYRASLSELICFWKRVKVVPILRRVPLTRDGVGRPEK